jgi:hypothetical protein
MLNFKSLRLRRMRVDSFPLRKVLRIFGFTLGPLGITGLSVHSIFEENWNSHLRRRGVHHDCWWKGVDVCEKSQY